MNKLADEYSNSYHCSIGTKPIDVDYFALSREIERNPKTPKFKVGDRVRISKYNSFFSKGDTENWSKEIFVIDSVLRNNTWT